LAYQKKSGASVKRRTFKCSCLIFPQIPDWKLQWEVAPGSSGLLRRHRAHPSVFLDK
jgi:hypothetical protein